MSAGPGEASDLSRLRLPTKRQLVASISSGYANAEWYNNHDCPVSAARIYERVRVWERMLEAGEYR